MTVTLENIDEFKKLYDKAVKEKKEVFVFHGADVLVTYAKYVIEYLDSIKS